jgi:hypothetical protein
LLYAVNPPCLQRADGTAHQQKLGGVIKILSSRC